LQPPPALFAAVVERAVGDVERPVDEEVVGTAVVGGPEEEGAAAWCPPPPTAR
jgi:hypothetical protein